MAYENNWLDYLCMILFAVTWVMLVCTKGKRRKKLASAAWVTCGLLYCGIFGYFNMPGYYFHGFLVGASLSHVATMNWMDWCQAMDERSTRCTSK